MGKDSRWLCNLFAFIKPPKPDPQQKWNGRRGVVKEDGGNAVVLEADKHAIAVAAATAAVAEAAVAAAKAAQAVVKLTSSGRCDTSSFYGSGKRGGMMERWAAVVIQSAFRGYLARRALKALKALVKLQALVRGHIVRKQTANQVRQMQALLRVQARARAGRGFLSEPSRSRSSSRSSQHHPTDPKTPEKSEEVRSRSPCRNQPSAIKRNTSKSVSRGTVGLGRPIQEANRVNNHDTNDRVWDPLMKACPSNDNFSDKILEVDSGKPHSTFKKENLFQALQGDTWRVDNQSQAAPSSNLSETVISTPIDYSCDLEEASFCTAENSPRFYSASSIGGGSSRGGPFTPTVSDSFHSYLSGSSDNPSYMSYTESSKAKLRSLSAPKQRPQYERSGSSKRHSYHAVNDSKSGAQRLSTSYSSFTSKAYPGSGRLDKLGMPVMRGDLYSSLYGHI